ncbi:hypothetical protein L0F63_003408 [Massospora cicadina]|nr:hypothetical protein L0F63_003408 [Massospora cicadina]
MDPWLTQILPRIPKTDPEVKGVEVFNGQPIYNSLVDPFGSTLTYSVARGRLGLPLQPWADPTGINLTVGEKSGDRPCQPLPFGKTSMAPNGLPVGRPTGSGSLQVHDRVSGREVGVGRVATLETDPQPVKALERAELEPVGGDLGRRDWGSYQDRLNRRDEPTRVKAYLEPTQVGLIKVPLDPSPKVRSALTKAKALGSQGETYKAVALLWNLAGGKVRVDSKMLSGLYSMVVEGGGELRVGFAFNGGIGLRPRQAIHLRRPNPNLVELWREGHARASSQLVVDMVATLNRAGIEGTDGATLPGGLTKSQAQHMLFLGYLALFNVGRLFSDRLAGAEVSLLSLALGSKYAWMVPPANSPKSVDALAREACSSAGFDGASSNGGGFRGEAVLRSTICLLHQRSLDGRWLAYLCWLGVYGSNLSQQPAYLKASLAHFASTEDPESMRLIENVLIHGLLTGKPFFGEAHPEYHRRAFPGFEFISLCAVDHRVVGGSSLEALCALLAILTSRPLPIVGSLKEDEGLVSYTVKRLATLPHRVPYGAEDLKGVRRGHQTLLEIADATMASDVRALNAIAGQVPDIGGADDRFLAQLARALVDLKLQPR